MINKQRKFDWFSLIIGILLVVLGTAALNAPGKTLSLIAIFVGVGALAKGLYTIWFRKSMQDMTGMNLTFLLVSSIVDIVIGIIFLLKIKFGIGILAYLFAFWFIFDSIIQLFADHFFKAMDRKYFDLLIVLNIITLILGIILLFNPMLSVYTLVGLVAFYLFFIGIIKIIQAF